MNSFDIRSRRGVRRSLWLSLLLLFLQPCLAKRTMAFSSQNLPPSTTRKLQDVDFSDVDFVFFERSLTLPNYTLSRVFGGQTIDLFLYNIICANITVGEVNIDWRVEQPQDIYVNLLVDDFDTTCTLDFTYSLETFQSGGWAEIFTSNSSIAADLLMQSSDLSKEPPSDVIVRDCDTNIKIDSVEFVGDLEGDFIVDTLNGLEGTLRGIMANEIGSAVCSSFGNVEDGLSAVFLIIADLLNPYVSKEETNPLYVEKNLTVPNHIQLVNFLQTESSIELLMDLVFGVASEYLATPAAGDQLVVDGIVRDLLLPDDKTLKINVSSIEYDFLKNPLEDLAEYGVAPADFGIMAVRFDRGGMVRGLDNFYSFDAIQQIGKHTVEVSFTLEEVLLDLLGTIDIRPNDGDMTEVDQTPFEVNLNMTKVDASIFFLLALDEKSLSDVQLGNFLGHGNLTCLLYSLYDLQITKVSINDFLYQPPTIGGLEDVPIVDALSNAILGLGFTAFDSLLADALPEILRQNVESFLEQFDSFSPLYNESCVEPTTEHVEGAYLDFRDLLLSPALAQEYGTNGSEPYGSFIPDIKDVLDRTVFADSPDTYRPFINERTVSSFTKRQSGEVGKINSEGVFFSYSRNVTMADLQAQVGIQLADLFLDNINTFYSPMNLFDPVKDLGTGLDNFLTLGDVDSPFRVAFNLIVDIDIDGAKETKNGFLVEIEMNSLTFVAKILLNIIEADLIKFPLGDLNRLHCLLALLEVPQLDKGGNRMPGVSPPYDIREFDLLMKDVKVDLSCSDCSSLAVTQLTAVAAPVLSSIFKAGVDVRVGGNGPEANGIVPTLERYLYSQRDEIRHEIDLFLSNTRQQCISHPDYDPDAFSPLKDAIRITGVGTVSRELPDDDRPGHILAACCALAAIAVAVGLVTNLTLRRIVARRQRRWLQSLSADQVVGILHQQKQKEAHQAKLNSLCSSVMCSTYVPTPIRICIPLALLVTFGLFLGGFLGAASEISVSAYFNGVDAISFSAGYSMASLVNETWQAGGEFLAVVTTLSSGVWPLLKQLLTLGLAFAPPATVSVANRGKYLLILDVLGKWSMFVIFLNLFNIAAFRTTIKSPSNQVLPYTIEVAYVPSWGLYSSFLAQLLSHIVSQTILHYHRKSVAISEQQFFVQERTSQTSSEKEEEEEEVIKEERSSPTLGASPPATIKSQGFALCNSLFVRPHRQEREWLRVKKQTNLVVLVIAFVSVALVISGCIVPVYSTAIGGLVSVVKNFGQDRENSVLQHSVFSIICALVDEARFLGSLKDTAGLLTFVVFMVVGVIIAPLVLIAALLFQWFYPLRPTRRLRLTRAIELLLSVQYVEVYVLSAILCALQIDDLSFNLVNSYCSAFDGILSGLARYGVIKWEDASCLTMKGSVEYAAILLVFAVVLIYLAALFITSAVQQNKLEGVLQAQLQQGPASETLEQESKMMPTVADQIQLLPVLFTDRFPWFLCPDEDCPALLSLTYTEDTNPGKGQLPSANADV